MLHDQCGEPNAARAATELRSGEVRIARALSRSAPHRWKNSAAQGFLEPDLDAEPKDGHQQQRRVLDGFYWCELGLSRSGLRGSGTHRQGSRELHSWLSHVPRHKPARAGKHATRDAAMGPVQGLVSRDRRLAQPTLRSRSAADDLRLRDDGEALPL